MKQHSKSFAQVRFFLACVLLLSVIPHAAAQQRGRGKSARKAQNLKPTARFDAGASALNVPLEMDGKIIFLRVSVNHSKPLRFLFDTGASVSAINQPRALELGLKPRGRIRGEGTGGKIQGSLIEGVSLSVPGAEVSNQLIASMPFATPPGVEFDGIIGYDFINQFVVEIDYRNKTMNLHDPRSYAYAGKGEIIPLNLEGRRTPLVQTKIIVEGRDAIAASLEVDTGADGTFLFNSPFVTKRKLLSAMKSVAEGGGFGAGGEQKRVVGEARAVQLGRFTFDNPPVALSLDTEGSGASAENDGLIGGEIFRRFKVILDYSHRRMILEPNENFKDPYEIEEADN